MTKVLLFNPRSAPNKPRIPNSILQVAASIEGIFDWVIVDGNRETDPWKVIQAYLDSGEFGYVGFTVMPGPQLQEAIPFTKRIRSLFPEIVMIWGGYFASNQYPAILKSGYVDYVVNGPGDHAFPALLQSLENGKIPEGIPNLIWMNGKELIKTPKAELIDLDTLPSLPYSKLAQFYSIQGYLGRTFLGKKTMSYHSSFGCPFTCSFCAVVPIYQARWKGMAASKIAEDILAMQSEFGVDSVEFQDNNFFVSEKRVAEFARLIKGKGIRWWGEARIDTMDQYKDETLALLRDSGCAMIFFGAESGNEQVLKSIDKGGKQNPAQILSFAKRMGQFGIIPEYSFVLGTPAPSPQAVSAQIEAEIQFIRKVKEANPATEIIIYVYSPVPNEGSELFRQVQESGFRFPEHLEDWLAPAWENFDLRKNPLTPWLFPKHVDRIRNFETVLNGVFPTTSDTKLTPGKRKCLRILSYWRYKSGIYSFPFEIKALHRWWKYRQPEITGFEVQ